MNPCRLAAPLLVLLALLSPCRADAALQTTPELTAPELSDDPEVLGRRLVALGVAPADAAARVAALTSTERAQLQRELEAMPAGGDALGAAAFAALVLLMTDILGYTDVFPFVTQTIEGPKVSAVGRSQCIPEATTAAAEAPR